jgi:hypothetical protein
LSNDPKRKLRDDERGWRRLHERQGKRFRRSEPTSDERFFEQKPIAGLKQSMLRDGTDRRRKSYSFQTFGQTNYLGDRHCRLECISGENQTK